ncbi:PREDICTED: sec-independent protein translocase protein TATA, chloroplastic-like [Camelina sativa]|uniref:Sec-independent protein translocase protein TATA, chloroplastic-like n=1 Tax=Camelina sativa TaxID=90675 RepID=A0ABM0VF14_CAMSA|nr:PREDICTED: sec-independent protein translocase protein TATA, chloroplastic-like [Camelina sativa]
MATSVATLSSPPPVSLPLSSSRSSFFSNCFTVPTRQNYRSLVAIRRRIRPEQTRKPLTCNALFGLGVPELAVIAGVAALLFGPKKLPEIGKSIGKTVKSFQQAAKEFESELKTEPEDSVTDSSPVAMSNKEEEKKAEVSSSSKENV